MGDITKNFDRAEFECRCYTCRAIPEPRPATKLEVILALQDMRDLLGQPLLVDRGISCPVHNQELGGARDSRHLPQHADGVDVRCLDSAERYRIVRAAVYLGRFQFIEVCPSHVHLDMRPGDKRLITGVSK